MVVGGLVVEPSCFSRNNFLIELMHTHNRSHLYTEVSTSSQTKLTLRVFNFHSAPQLKNKKKSRKEKKCEKEIKIEK